MIKAVILVGGPSISSTMKPLCTDIPTPFFPIAGVETIYHHINALGQISNLSELIFIGFYEKSLFTHFIEKIMTNFKINCRYIREESVCGTGGGIAMNIDNIFDSSTEYLIVMHCDIISDFPFISMLEFHKKHGKMATLMSITLDKLDKLSNYGNLVKHSETNELIHHAEKPLASVSNLINCGVYIFSKSVKEVFIAARKEKLEKFNQIKNSIQNLLMISNSKELNKDYLMIERDILMKYASRNQIYIYQLEKGINFWKKVDSARDILECSKTLLTLYQDDPTIYKKCFKIKEFNKNNTLIHFSAHVDPSASIGPNVTIGAGARIGKGVKIENSIILEGVEIKDYSCILNSILCWNSTIGYWCRIEGKTRSENEKDGICLLGVGVTVENEKCIRNCIVLPHKTLNKSYANEILI